MTDTDGGAPQAAPTKPIDEEILSRLPPKGRAAFEKLVSTDLSSPDAMGRLFLSVPNLGRIKRTSAAAYEYLRGLWKKAGLEGLMRLDREVQEWMSANAAPKAATYIDGNDGFERSDSKGIVGNRPNIELALQKLHIALRYDMFRGQPVVEGLKDYGPALDDAALRRLWFLLDEKFGFRPERHYFDEVIFLLCNLPENRIHPVLAELDWAQTVWDGVPRLDTWLIDYAGAADKPYTRAVSALVLIAAVRRVRKPGVKFDEMLVLESGEQGLGKSSLIAALAIHPEWFTDSVPLNVDDKQMIERTSGHWIIEVPELQGMRKGEVERIRSQLSRGTDRARMAYARLPTETPRQFVMIGSTNGDRSKPYLADIAGNRRFWPVEVGYCDVSGFTSHREQIWGEAAAREAAGESIRLPERLWSDARAEQEARAIGNPFTDMLATHLDGWDGVLRADDAWRLVNVPVERRAPHAGNLGAAMKDLGWIRKQRRLGDNGTAVGVYAKGESDRLLTVNESPFRRGELLVSPFESEAEDDY